jgi:hypothetical protein
MRCDAHDVLPSISKGSRNRRVGPVSGGGYRLRAQPLVWSPASSGTPLRKLPSQPRARLCGLTSSGRGPNREYDVMDQLRTKRQNSIASRLAGRSSASTPEPEHHAIRAIDGSATRPFLTRIRYRSAPLFCADRRVFDQRKDIVGCNRSYSIAAQRQNCRFGHRRGRGLRQLGGRPGCHGFASKRTGSGWRLHLSCWRC